MSLEFKNPKIKEYMLEGHFGLEKESLRVTPEGYLAHTRHPFMNDPNMERDFCENQTELITNVTDSVEEVWEQLAGLQKKSSENIVETEIRKRIFVAVFQSTLCAGGERHSDCQLSGGTSGKRIVQRISGRKIRKKENAVFRYPF